MFMDDEQGHKQAAFDLSSQGNKSTKPQCTLTVSVSTASGRLSDLE